MTTEERPASREEARAAMNQRVQFTAPLPPVALRRNSLTPRYGYQRKLRREYSKAVYEAALEWKALLHLSRNSAPPFRRAHVALEWRSRRKGPDADNALASCKALIDCLRVQRASDSKDEHRYWLGIIEDDGEGVTFSIAVTKIRAPEEDGVVITITEGEA